MYPFDVEQYHVRNVLDKIEEIEMIVQSFKLTTYWLFDSRRSYGLSNPNPIK